MLKRILISLALLFVLFIGTIVILPGLVPTDTYRTRLEADLSQTFARDVQIIGDINISTFPVLKIETGAVSLANPEGFPQGQFVEIDAMSAKVRLWPLLSKRVEISGITLQSPSIRLDRQADGRENWISRDVDNSVEKGPFKRDGRYTEYDPALALLRIQDGTLQYIDAVADQRYTLENINLDLKAPGLDKPLSVDGQFDFDGLNTAIYAEIGSPADFLNGLETAIAVDVQTAEGEAKVTGRFLPGENITLDAAFGGSSEAPNALASRLPLPDDLALPKLSSVTSSANISYDPASTKLSDLDITVEGDGLNADFSGDIDLSDGATNSGSFSINLNDTNIVQPYLDEPIAALRMLNSATVNGDVTWTGNKVSTSGMTANLIGTDLTANFNGDAGYDSALSLSGSFDGQTGDISKLIEASGLSQPDAVALKQVTANGQITFSDGRMSLTKLVAVASNGLLNGTYDGEVTSGESVVLNGIFTGEIDDLGALDAALPREIPYSNVVNRIEVSSRIKSQSNFYTLSEVSAALQDGMLIGEFNGRLTVGDKSDVTGNLTLSAGSLRRIAATQNITLPTSTDLGSIFERVSLAGAVSGTPEKISFTSGTIGLDEISGRGDFSFEMSGAKPLLTGSLDLNALDLRPYMAAWSAQNPTGKILPWSEEKITLAGLESMDAKVNITTPSIIMDRLELGKTAGVANLQSGILTANLENTKLYGGDAAGTFSIQSLNGTPTVSVDATITSVAAQKFFSASAGFEKVTGTSDMTLAFNGQGKSQAEIMKSLSGEGVYKVLNGQLLGLDVGALLTGVDQALTTRQLPQGIGLGKSTNFNDLGGQFSLTNGRANVSGLQLQSGAFVMDAEGTVDIGQQTIDVSIRPKLSGGSDLAKFGIPLRFTGGFGDTKPKLDTSLLGDIAKARARQKAGDTVRENLGGPLGEIFGGVIGGQAPEQEPTPTEDITQTETPAESVSENAAPQEQSPTETPESETPEEQIGNALKDLFGRKKKEEKSE